MKVFLSWSVEGSQSHQVAKALRDWLPSVIQQLKPWLSSQDIKTGSKWQSDLNRQLADTRFGIFSITNESKDRPYLLFEAGALSRYVEEESYVCPYYFELKPTDVNNPISEYQGSEATKEGTFKLLKSINSALSKDKLPNEKLEESFSMWWPSLDTRLEKIKKYKGSSTNSNKSPPREQKEILEEILSLTRKISNGTINTQDAFNDLFASEEGLDEELLFIKERLSSLNKTKISMIELGEPVEHLDRKIDRFRERKILCEQVLERHKILDKYL